MAADAMASSKPSGSSNPSGQLVDVVRALSDPTRLRIFLCLRQAERCVRDLVDSEGIPQPLVSHHLRVLTEAGLVQARSADRFRLYAVDPRGMDDARALLLEVLDAEALTAAARPGGNSDCCK